MTSRACPQLPELPVAGTGPITCVCCGKPLVLTCPGECGTAHVRASIARTARPTHVCARCRQPIERTPKGGRPPKVCDRCLTPDELARRIRRRKAAA